MSLTNINNLVASDTLIIPCQLENYCLEGIPTVFNLTDTVKQINSNLIFGGIFVTFHDKRKVLNKEVLSDLKNHFKDNFFETTISDSVKLAEAPANQTKLLKN